MITKPTYWTRWRVRRVLATIYQELVDEENLRYASMRTVTVTKALARHGIPAEFFSVWEKNFFDDTQITQSIRDIRSYLESRIVEETTKNHYNDRFSIFNLKNNYGWRDEQHLIDASKEQLLSDVKEIREALSDEVNEHKEHGKRS